MKPTHRKQNKNMNTYPPVTVPAYGINSADVARQYGLPADLYTNGLYLHQAFHDADLRLTNAMKARLPRPRIREAEEARRREWHAIIDGIREEMNHIQAMEATYGTHGQG